METSTLAQALQAVVAGDTAAAGDRAAQAAERGSLLGTALAEFLRTEPAADVYTEPAAFEAFIGGGGNIPLYRATSTALAKLYDQHRPAALLDIGCGNGRALLPALRAAQHQPSRIGLVEPSPALLSTAVAGLPPAEVETWPTTIQAFLEDLGPESHWPVAQSTFALHTIPHDERTAVLAQLRPHVNVLAIADFDVPDHSTGSLEQLRFLAETYEQGLAEYDADRDLVAQGFLLPVLVGQLQPGTARVTWEQSRERWREQLTAAGYRQVRVSRLYDYWSSPAFLLIAS